MLPIKIQNNIENKRAPQGPYISVTNQVMVKKRERDISSRERLSRQGSRNGQRSVSRDSSISSVGRIDYKSQQPKDPVEKPTAPEVEGENEQQKVQQVVQAA